MAHLDLTSSKVHILMPSPSMASAVLKYFERNRDHLAPTSPNLPPTFYTEEYWKKRLSDSIAEFETDRSVRLFFSDLNQPAEIIGSVNFTQIFRGAFQACYLGYSIARTHQGRGLMFDALQTSIRYMFDQRHLHRIMANYLPENERSANVLARLGFRIDGRSPDYLFIAGSWREHVLTSLTNPNWKPRSEDADLFP